MATLKRRQQRLLSQAWHGLCLGGAAIKTEICNARPDESCHEAWGGLPVVSIPNFGFFYKSIQNSTRAILHFMLVAKHKPTHAMKTFHVASTRYHKFAYAVS